MANIKSAQKRARQTVRKTTRNKSVLSAMRLAIKNAKTSKQANTAEATGAIKLAVSRIMKAASKGIIHKNTASRYVSRLSKIN
ncbi:MAG: 30S ribosomal protein S20 [Bdellovibrionota bacterium]